MSLPDGWVEVRLDDVAEVRLGRQRSPDKAFGDNLVPYLRAANVRWEGLDLSDVKTMQFSAEEVRTFQLRRNDLLVVEASGSRDEVGKVAQWKEELPLACLQNTLLRVRSRGPDPAFLRWRLHFDAVVGGLGGASQGIGIHHIGAERLSSWTIGLPPIAEQRRIVAKLEETFEQSRAVKARLQRLPSLLEKLKSSILLAAFRGDLTKDWRAANPAIEPASVLLERLRRARSERLEHALRARGKDPAKAKNEDTAHVTVDGPWRLPSSWTWARIAEVGEVQLGRQRAPQYLTGKWPRPYLRVANVKEDRISVDDLHSMDFDPKDFERYRLVAGDILLSEGQSPELVGESGIYAGGIDGLCYQKTLHRFRADPAAISSALAQLVFRLHLRVGIFRSNATLTTNIAHLTLVRLKPIPFPLPPLAEQKVIVERVGRMLASVEALHQKVSRGNQAADTIETGTLAKAFRGELVPQDPGDEPASVLLDRIRAARQAEPERTQRGRSARVNHVAVTTRVKYQPTNGHVAKGVDADPVDLVVAAFQQGRRLTATDIGKATGLAAAVVKRELKRLVEDRLVQIEGRTRDAGYVWTA